MKTIRRPKSRNKAWISTWIAVGIFVVAVLIHYGSVSVAVPFMKIGTYMHSAGVATVGVFSSKKSLEIENEKLKNDLADVQVIIDRNKLLTQENLDLKELLGRQSKNSSILAVVISKPPMSLYDTLIVDVGSANNVSAGDMVFANGYVPVGIVNAVHQNTSIVQLFSSAGQKIDVRIGKNIQTTAESESGGNFLIRLPKGTEVAEGDVISAPGIGAEIFGHVSSIEKNENDPFIFVRFILPVNISELHFLQIKRALNS